jgi:hypothetical protein
VSMGRIKSLYRISLLGKDSVESLARSGKSASNTPVALCVTPFRCFVEKVVYSLAVGPGT